VREPWTRRATPAAAMADICAQIDAGRTALKITTDPARIGVWGASAGGHLALVADVMADDGKPAAANPLERSGNSIAVVAYFPSADMRGRIKAGPIDFDDKHSVGLADAQRRRARSADADSVHGGAPQPACARR